MLHLLGIVVQYTCRYVAGCEKVWSISVLNKRKISVIISKVLLTFQSNASVVTKEEFANIKGVSW